MGSSSWSVKDFVSYSASALKCSVTADGYIADDVSVTQLYKSHRLDEALNPKDVLRECRDSEEHKNTIPVILALDVTGSMGPTAEEVAKQLNVIMTKLYEQITDVEFLVMGIGDLAYDSAPIQAGQFESDIRIAEQLGKIFFEFGGGSNPYESYTAAWYFGARHTDLDCWKRGKKGIIITMGDEELNPYLPWRGLREALGGVKTEKDIETTDLYKEVSEKYNVYHIQVNHRYCDSRIPATWKAVIGDNYKESTINGIVDTVVDIITTEANSGTLTSSEGISW